MIAIKTIIFTLLLPGTAIVYVPWLLLRAWPSPIFDPGPLRYLALPLGLLGLAVYVRCAWDFGARGGGTPAPIDPPKALVAEGLYRYSRNPMYVGVLLMLLAECVWFGSLALVLWTLAIFSMFQAFILLYEEPTLRRSFGPAYERFCREVPRWLPLGGREAS